MKSSLLIAESDAELRDTCLRLAERVERKLRTTGYRRLQGIEVTVHERLVILAGRVPSYYLKWVAQTTTLAVPGVQQIRNDLEVGRPVCH